jgi:multicomponent Na+:H+ antiporter subunit D
VARKSERLRNTLTFAGAATAALVTLSMIPGVLNGVTYKAHLMQMTPRILQTPSIWLHLRVDPVGILFALTAATLWLLATVYSFGYMKDSHAKTRYYAFLLLCLGWTLGVAFAGNLLTLFIFYELFSISSYPLIIHEETPEAIQAAKKYIVYILIGGSFILFSIVYTFSLANSQTLVRTGVFPAGINSRTLCILFTTYIIGFGVKAAIMPLHGWVPDAHPAAPAPASALLSGVMVAAGAFGIIRVIYNVFGTELLRQMGICTPLAFVVSATIIISSLIALDQDNLKRRLAYSTIGQISYIIMGTALLTPVGAHGALIHIANHAFMKGTLFLCAGVIIKQLGIRNISEMKGIASKLPITMTAFSIAALGMIGVPPLAGFISKFYLGIGSLNAGEPFMVVVLLVSSFLGAAYFLPIIYTAFFQQPDKEKNTRRNSRRNAALATADDPPSGSAEAPVSMLVPIAIGAAYTVVFGIFAATGGLPLSLAKAAVRMFLK